MKVIAYLRPVRCSLIIESLNANQSNASLLKRFLYVCSEKCPYLPNWRKLIRFGIAMNNFIVSMKAFSKGLLIFTTDLRAVRHSDWYCIRSVSLVIIRRVLETSNLLKTNKLCNTFFFFYQLFSCFFCTQFILLYHSFLTTFQ